MEEGDSVSEPTKDTKMDAMLFEHEETGLRLHVVERRDTETVESRVGAVDVVTSKWLETEAGQLCIRQPYGDDPQQMQIVVLTARGSIPLSQFIPQYAPDGTPNWLDNP